jgi:rhodanese-related sulfurtransferase
MENLGEFIVNHWLLCTAFVVLAWIVFSDGLQQKLSGVIMVTTAQAIQMINQQKALFIDVREKDEFEKEHIADAVNMPVSTLNDAQVKQKDKAKPIIIVCASGQRARAAVKQLKAKGFSDLYVLKGGINEWKAAKLPLFS